MLIDRYGAEDVFARVPELASQTDPVLRQLDTLLEDEVLYVQIASDLATRFPLTALRGRPSTPVEVILRLLVVQHLYAWSYAETVQRVADSLVLRWFSRVYFHPVPDATTLLRWAHPIRPVTLQALMDRVIVLARHARLTQGRRLRLDSTCVQTPIHPPGLMGDGVRVLARLLRQAKRQQLAGIRDAFRSRQRTVRRALQQAHRLRRHLGATPGDPDARAQRHRQIYTTVLQATRQMVRQAERVRTALGQRRPRRAATRRLRDRIAQRLETFLPRIRQAIAQAQRRVVEGAAVPAREKVVSLFEPHTRIMPRHKGGAALEFGRQVVVDEVDGGLVTRVYILADGESEHHQALPALAHHCQLFGHPPWLLTGDRGLHAAGVEAAAQALGVRHVAIPQTGQVGPARRAVERTRAWRRYYRWRSGIEGRIHSLRRDDGLARCRSHGLSGLERDVHWGVLVSNLRHLARTQAARV
jgi:transposase, IS5 family